MSEMTNVYTKMAGLLVETAIFDIRTIGFDG